VSIFTKAFWQDTAERTIRGTAQGVVVGLGAAQFTDVGQAVSLTESALIGGLGVGILTFFTCLAASQVGQKGTAAFVAPAETTGQHQAPQA
jgi:hypothetical protein